MQIGEKITNHGVKKDENGRMYVGKTIKTDCDESKITVTTNYQTIETSKEKDDPYCLIVSDGIGFEESVVGMNDKEIDMLIDELIRLKEEIHK